MNIQSPTSSRFTVYTKKNCSYCEKVKDELEHHFETPEIIPCDDFLSNDYLSNDYLSNDYLINSNSNSNTKKQVFVAFMNSLTKDKFKTFPVVFFDKTFIGGYNETVLYLQK